jgi:DedD protein
MERHAKERLIGASILLLLIVLVVPELLSGPKPTSSAAPSPQLPAVASSADSIRNVTLDLGTSTAPNIPEATPAEATAAAGAPPAASAPQPSTLPASSAASQAGAPAAANAPLPVETVAPALTSNAVAHGEAARAGWAVQLGSFASLANADKLTHQLKAQGFAVYVLSGGSGTAIRHRVRVGPMADKDTAERMAAKLKALGHPSSLVHPGA